MPFDSKRRHPKFHNTPRALASPRWCTPRASKQKATNRAPNDVKTKPSRLVPAGRTECGVVSFPVPRSTVLGDVDTIRVELNMQMLPLPNEILHCYLQGILGILVHRGRILRSNPHRLGIVTNMHSTVSTISPSPSVSELRRPITIHEKGARVSHGPCLRHPVPCCSSTQGRGGAVRCMFWQWAQPKGRRCRLRLRSGSAFS